MASLSGYSKIMETYDESVLIKFECKMAEAEADEPHLFDYDNDWFEKHEELKSKAGHKQ